MSEWIFDAETDGLLLECSRMHIIYFFNLKTKEHLFFLEGDLGWQEILNNATLVVGHNVCGFDIPMLEKLFNFKLPAACKVRDTLIMSSVLDYRRFKNDGHSMKRWGEKFNQPKQEHEDWSVYSQEMFTRCKSDVLLNYKIYNDVLPEFQALYAKNKSIATYLKAENAVALWCARANLHGWPFDKEAAIALWEEISGKANAIYDLLEPKLGIKAIAKDKKNGIVPEKKPKWTKNGCYDMNTANWFEINPYSGYEGEERPIAGPYCRVEFKPLLLSSVTDVKVFLFRHGWVPTTYNTKFDPITRRNLPTTPKITEDSLEFLGGDGALYAEYLMLTSRANNIKTWIANVDEDGMLHGSCFTIGTPSMRMRHNIIVNVPSGELKKDGTAESPYGPEMRKLFKCIPGWKLIGCDSSGNQARGLAHYLGDAEFIDILLHGDIHQYNADKLTEVLASMGIDRKVTRAQAKRILYAFLFGASGGKIWSYIFGAPDMRKGNKLKLGFTRAVPGFNELVSKLERIYGKTSTYGIGYIPGPAGNRIYVDSFHKLLVYLLQATEKATCSAAVMLTMERLEMEKIPYVPLIMMHDEEDFMVPEEYAERAAEIGKQAFADGPKLFDIEIMDGSAKIGDNWFDIH